jgi:hypothetical protein
VNTLTLTDPTYPGRVRIVVDEDQGNIQMGLLWGIRSRYYDSAATAALTYEAEALTPLDAAGTASSGIPSGSSGGTVVQHPAIGTDWTPVLSTRMRAGTADLTHQGTYRVWVRAYSGASTPPALRLAWDVGDLAFPVLNTRKQIPGSGNYFMVDLGEIRLDAIPTGAHRWQGVIQALGTTGSEDVVLDHICFQPIDDGAGRLTANLNSDPGLAGAVARDAFAQTAGTLTGKVMPLGGTWAGAGGTADFSLNTTDHVAQRTFAADTPSLESGRFALAGTATYASSLVSIDFKTTATTPVQWQGPVARYTDTNNCAYAVWRPDIAKLELYKRIAGSSTSLTGLKTPPSGTPVALVPNMWFTLRLAILATGDWFVFFGPTGGLIQLVQTGRDTDLATGGTLQAGRVGFRDSALSGPVTRSYDRFIAWPASFDATLFANRSAELRTEGMFRQDTTGTAYGPAPHVGDLPRIPPSGLENRKVELFLKASRGDFDQIADSAIDDLSARVSYRPTWLLVPGS